MIFSKKTLISMAMLSTAGLLVGCGGSSSSKTSSSSTGTFSLAITDGPVDSAVSVVVEFTGVSIKPANGEALVFDFADVKSIDLLQLQGSASDGLLTDEVVPSGSYEWIRLHVNAEGDGNLDSYMEMNDGTMVELYIPSGGQSGLKLVNGFTVAAGGGVDFTIDFDLRKSITLPPGMPDARLKPALRLVDNMLVGSVAGAIDGTLVGQECADATVNDGSVYVYSGADVTPVDIQGEGSDPVVSSLVAYDELEGTYSYELGFLEIGDYTVAYTCGAASDDPALADTLTFIGTTTVSVSAGDQTTHDFSVEAEVEVEVTE